MDETLTVLRAVSQSGAASASGLPMLADLIDATVFCATVVAGPEPVPVAAAVYYNDMYVDRELSMQTAAAIRGLRAWVTSEYEHDALRVSDGAVLDRLIGMVRGNI